MRVPKVTRTRFILMWAVGVALVFLISWKSYFRSGEKVQSEQDVSSERKNSHAAELPGQDAKAIDPRAQIHQALGPPSSVLDAMKPGLDTHKDPNVFDVGRPESQDIAQDINDMEDDINLRPDAKTSNQLNQDSFLAVPHQEMDEDGKSFSKEEELDDEESSSQSSDVASKDDQNAEVVQKRENPAKAGLFDDNTLPVLPNSLLNQDGEKDEVALGTAKPSRETSYEDNVHQPRQNGLLISESQKDGLQSPPETQTLLKNFDVDRNVVPEDRMRKEDSQDAVKTFDSALSSQKLVHRPTENLSQGELEKQHIQSPPSGVFYKERTDAVAMETGEIPEVKEKSVNSQLLASRFVDNNHPETPREPKRIAPGVQLYGGRGEQVAMDTAILTKEGILHRLPDTQLDEFVIVTEKPMRAEFHQDGETNLVNASDEHLEETEIAKLAPGASKSLVDSKFHGSLNLADSTRRDSSLSNAIMNQPTQDDNIASRIPGRNLPRKITIQEGGPVPRDAARLGSDLEFRQPPKPVVSAEVQVNSHSSTGVNGKVVPPENETEEEFMERMDAVQRDRHERLRQQCQTRYNLTPLDFQRDRQKILSWKKYYEHAYANDDHQFIICRELKAASFSWRKVMISLYNKGSPEFQRSQKMGDFPMMNYDDDTFMSKLQNYKKILFVREPFARFLSAYRDKYVELRHFPYYHPIGMSIIRKYRKNPSQAEIMSGRPTFEEFTRWVVTEEVPEGDYHWRPLFNWYHPCQIPYEFIGKVETAVEDAKYIFKMVGIDKLETFPSTETHHKFSSSADVLKEFYSQLPAELLPRLINRYKEEFELFDYPVPRKMSDIWTTR